VASEETSTPPVEPSSWSRLPAIDGNGEPSSGARARAAAAPSSVSSASASFTSPTSPTSPTLKKADLLGTAASVGAAIRGGAERVSVHLGERLDQAKAAFDSPSSPELEALYQKTDLPQLVASDPIGSLAVRLDREADLWRSLALRALARAGWADRIAQGTGIVVGLGAVALAVIAGLGALFGAEGSVDRVVLVGAALGALTTGALLVTWISGTIRKAQRDLAREATLRADLAELRLHRIGVVTALLQIEPDAGRQALARLERDVSAPPR
jgi:hypothetical protein